MKIEFNVNCQTQWGDTLFVLIKDKEGNEKGYEMFCHNKNSWIREIEFKESINLLSYRYAILGNNEKKEEESNNHRTVKIDSQHKKIELRDEWKLLNGDSVFETKMFQKCLFQRIKTKSTNISKSELHLQLYLPKLEPNKYIAILGNQSQLGNWDITKKVKMDDSNFPIWSVNLDINEIKNTPLEYKYLIVDKKSDEILQWEEGENRKVETIKSGQLTIITNNTFKGLNFNWKTAGVVLPIFSLRSEESFGTGDFMDLKLLVDWAKTTGQHIIQTLPINDTILNHSNQDSYPYNAVSVYALHPIYLRLEKMGILKDKKSQTYFKKTKQILNKNNFSDYQRVLNEKWKYFQLIYKQEKENIFNSNDYKTFFNQNKNWLVPYSVFSFLRDKNYTPNFNQWEEYRIFNKKDIEKLSAENSPFYDEIAFFYFLQYHLHIQLVEVRDYAHKHKIVLKSDVPIGVSPKSVDVWVEPSLFNTQMQAGAPPDDFSKTGQNWGFPTYNWEEMEKDGYKWWNNRFKKFEEYFDAYRIDHILGFFRIWEIPKDAVWALTGSFYPAMPYFVQDLEAKGLTWNENRYTKPYIKEKVVKAIFGEYADEVLKEYLEYDKFKNITFKSEFDTQKKIEKYFSKLKKNFSQKEKIIRDGLFELHCEVLFVKDNRNPNMYHPRIAMHSTHTFKNLSAENRRKLDEIYVDYFYHRHNQFWKQQAYKKLPVIRNATSMLACGEDLGMVPQSVPEVMEKLELLSLEIQRMPKKENVEFAMPNEVPYFSVCTTSTHDMNPIRAWWKEDKKKTQRFYNNALESYGTAPKTCTGLIAEKIIEQHLDSTAMLVILPWQDWLAIDENLRLEDEDAERINVPSNPQNFWCYRMHLTLEQLLKEKALNKKIKSMITTNGR